MWSKIVRINATLKINLFSHFFSMDVVIFFGICLSYGNKLRVKPKFCNAFELNIVMLFSLILFLFLLILD